MKRQFLQKNVQLAYLNINSVRNKFSSLLTTLNGNLDVVAIAETKIDNSFPSSQFLITNFKTPFRLDVSQNKDGLLVYVKNGIPSRQLSNLSLPNDIQVIIVEIRLTKTKWLAIFIYRPPSQHLEYFLNNLNFLLDFYSEFKNCIIMGDFNCEPSHPKMLTFLYGNLLYNHMKSKTYFKTAAGTCIDLILSNQKFSLQHTSSVDTGLSDFHHLISNELKCKYTKGSLRNFTYRNYKNFNEINLLNDLSDSLLETNIYDYEIFKSIFETVLDKHAPFKSKWVRGNGKPFMNEELRKAIMKRSRLRNAYRKQRNFVTNLLRKTRKSYFESEVRNTSHNSHEFWKVCKPFFSKKKTARILIIFCLFVMTFF